MKVKVIVTLQINEREYQMPLDGNVGKELEQAIEEYLFDVEGVKVIHIKSLSE